STVAMRVSLTRASASIGIAITSLDPAAIPVRAHHPSQRRCRWRARSIASIKLKVPTNPSSNLNIGMLGGSQVVNAKASDAWFSVDLRSTSNKVIADLEKQIKAILDEEAARVGMKVKTDVISKSPAATIPGHRESYLVRISEAVHRVMGFDPPITNAGSNNSSAALLAGISSISTGAGPCDGSHSLAENCE